MVRQISGCRFEVYAARSLAGVPGDLRITEIRLARGVDDYLVLRPNTWANWAAIRNGLLLPLLGVLWRINGLGRIFFG